MSIAERLTARGVTLVELLVALVVLAIGVLGLSASAAIVARQTHLSQLQVRLAARSRSAMEERLAGVPSSLQVGVRVDTARVHSRQEVPGLVELRVVVTESLGHSNRADTLVTRVRAP